jgi:hypothetical protein
VADTDLDAVAFQVEVDQARAEFRDGYAERAASRIEEALTLLAGPAADRARGVATRHRGWPSAGRPKRNSRAAAIMVAVFAAFVPSPDVVLKVIGVGMAAAIFIDATVVRLLLVPAVMHLLGRANWWMPGWLGRLLPELSCKLRGARRTTSR